MVLRAALIFLGTIVLTGCAQIGFLTGGEIDSTAPEPVRCEPLNGSTRFSENRVQLYFDEYIQLKDVSENIFITPQDAKLKSSLNKKVLTVEWEEQLAENTTYAIYFNNAVSDFTEDNSTLFSYVFSTGNNIDTLTTAVNISDVLTNSPVADILVGLYRSQDSITPRYFATSDKRGFAQFTYLEEGAYAIRAFKDENRDMKIGGSEIQGFVLDSVRVSTSNNDTTMLSVFTPEPENLIANAEFKGPGVFELNLTSRVPDVLLKLNDQQIKPEQFRTENNQLFRIFTNDSLSQTNILTVTNGDKTDSSTIRISKKEQQIPLAPTVLSSPTLAINSPIILQFNALIDNLDTSKIYLWNENDSLEQIAFSLEIEKDLVKISPKTSGKFQLKLLDGLIDGMNRSFTTSVEVREKKDLGNLIAALEGFTRDLIVELSKEKDLIQSRIVTEPVPILFENLLPGEYTIRIVVDSNRNGKWDTGNLSKLILPEKVINYGSVRVRPNWDVKVPLIVNN